MEQNENDLTDRNVSSDDSDDSNVSVPDTETGHQNQNVILGSENETSAGRNLSVHEKKSFFYTWKEDLEGDDNVAKQRELARLIDSLPPNERTVYLPEDTFSIMAISWPAKLEPETSKNQATGIKKASTDQDANQINGEASKSGQKGKDKQERITEAARSALFLSVVVFLIQAATLYLLYKDIIDRSKILSLFSTRVVRWAQLLAILIAILSQTDVISAIDVLINGCPSDDNEIVMPTNNGDLEQNKNSTPLYRFRPNGILWHVANFLRFVEGLSCLVVTFLLVLNSSSVRDVLLNFTAAEFISNVDNIAYKLVRLRYFGRPVYSVAKHPIISSENFEALPTKYQCCKSQSQPWTKPMFILFLTLIAFTSWMVVCWKQVESLPKSFYIQFGDDEDFSLGFASGIYTRRSLPQEILVAGESLIYDLDDEHEFRADQRTSLHFCSEDSTWRLMGSEESCGDGNWRVKSSPIEDSFALPSSEDQLWYNRIENSTMQMQMKYIRIVENSTLIEPTEEQYGSGCLIYEGQANLIGPVESNDGSISTANHYQLLTCITAYRRPVYARRTLRGVAVLMSTGRRWAHVYGGSQYVAGQECHTNITFAQLSEDFMDCDPLETFYPFSGEEKQAISDLVRTLEWQLRLGETDVSVVPEWHRLNYTTEACSDNSQNALPTWFSDVFDVQSLSDSGSPAELRLYKTSNFPEAPKWFPSRYKFDQRLGPYDKKPFTATHSVEGFSKCTGGDTSKDYQYFNIQGCDRQIISSNYEKVLKACDFDDPLLNFNTMSCENLSL